MRRLLHVPSAQAHHRPIHFTDQARRRVPHVQVGENKTHFGWDLGLNTPHQSKRDVFGFTCLSKRARDCPVTPTRRQTQSQAPRFEGSSRLSPWATLALRQSAKVQQTIEKLIHDGESGLNEGGAET